MALEKRVLYRRLGSTDIISPRDFRSVGRTRVDLATLLAEHPESISPYALDSAKREVVFVRTPSGTDLAKAHPFFYEAQRIHATSTIHASVDEVVRAASELSLPAHRFVFLYSPGRAGSTITGRIAGRLPGVQDLSEPDFYAQAVLSSDSRDPARRAELVAAVGAASRILAHHRLALDPTRRTLFVKHRGFALYGAELLREAVPSSSAMYLGRDAADVIESYLGTFFASPIVKLVRALGLDRLAVRVLRAIWPRTYPEIARRMPLVVDPRTPDRDSHGAVELLALGFHSMCEEVERLDRTGAVPFADVLRYEDLAASPSAYVRRLAVGLGIDASDDVVAHALEATRANVQAGSNVASDGTHAMSDADRARVRRAIASVRPPALPAGAS